MLTEDSKIIRNVNLKKNYFQIDFSSSQISCQVKPGQFVNIQIPGLIDSIFRRPFSVYKIEGEVLSIIYKVVGKGTDLLSKAIKGTVCNLLGPLGTSYTLPARDEFPIIAVGGYGSAATYILAQKSSVKGIVLVGAKTADDILLAEEYEKLGFEVVVATDDGSRGYKGMVTELLEKYTTIPNAVFYGCGPNVMMYSMARTFRGRDGIRAELSLDHPMCCGVGACFACVVKVRDATQNTWHYARSCKEGPVFRQEDLFI